MSVTVILHTAKALTQAAKSVDMNLQREFVDVMVEVAKKGAPFDTGNLRRSITSAQKSSLKWEVFTATGYGAYLELGTKSIKARPYFAPAYETARKGLAGRWNPHE